MYCHNYIDNNDYDTGPYTVTIPAGENDVTFSVSITDDNIREQSETFILIIDASSLPNGVTSSDPNDVTVTIMDDDSKCIIYYPHGTRILKELSTCDYYTFVMKATFYSSYHIVHTK